MSPASAFAETVDGGIRVAVRLTPGASRDLALGVHRDADGRIWLKASVRAAPERGRANEALIALVAAAAGVPKTSVALESGGAGRRKVLLLKGAGPAEMARLSRLAPECGTA